MSSLWRNRGESIADNLVMRSVSFHGLQRGVELLEQRLFSGDFRNRQIGGILRKRLRQRDNPLTKILLREDVRYGHTDPELDPGGYRALLCWQLAEKHYHQPGLDRRLLEKFEAEDQLSDGRRIQERMQAGTLDYFFGYKASAERRGNLYLELPAEINFSVPEQADFYQQAKVEIAGKNAGEKMLVRGAPIRYSVSLLKAAEEKAVAWDFLRFLFQRRKDFLTAAGFSSLKLEADAGTDMAVGAEFWQDIRNREGAE